MYKKLILDNLLENALEWSMLKTLHFSTNIYIFQANILVFFDISCQLCKHSVLFYWDFCLINLKFWKHVFEISVDPKGSPSEPTFWLGFEAPGHWGPAWPRLFSRQKWPKKLKMENKPHNLNFSWKIDRL